MTEPVENGGVQKVISSKELFGTAKQILIQHGGVLYRLTITRQGKLILNK